VDEPLLKLGVSHMRDLGHRIVVSDETGHEWRYFAGTDEQRLAGFHTLVDDPSIDLVMAARGGYGMSRLLHRIDWNRVAASGKAFVGFSDFTAFNMAAYACANLLTFHGPMLTSDFGKEHPTRSPSSTSGWRYRVRATHRRRRLRPWLRRAADRWCSLGGQSVAGGAPGRHSVFPTIDGGIFYVEDIKEEPYAIERQFLQLYHAGILARQRAVVLGDFASCSATNTQRYPYSMEEVVESLRVLLPIPVLTNFPFGHIERKVTLPFGGPGTLQIRKAATRCGSAGTSALTNQTGARYGTGTWDRRGTGVGQVRDRRKTLSSRPSRARFSQICQDRIVAPY
jgi:muramoyltetrapeptide carboxypeptidase